jgi:hypothetical protein
MPAFRLHHHQLQTAESIELWLTRFDEAIDFMKNFFWLFCISVFDCNCDILPAKVLYGGIDQLCILASIFLSVDVARRVVHNNPCEEESATVTMSKLVAIDERIEDRFVHMIQF